MDRFASEWLETNGLGGFASSTACGMNTRRYHGLLMAATQPPVGRMLLLSKFEETLVVAGRRYELSVNQYAGAVYPDGREYLREFSSSPYPKWVYEVAGVRVEKRVLMIHSENTVIVEYAMEGDAQLELRPLIAFRDYHSLTHENGALDGSFTEAAGRVALRPYADVPVLYLAHDAEAVDQGYGWYRNFEYAVERERGLDCHEDLFNPLVMRFTGPATVIASTTPHAVADAASLRDRELARRAAIVAAAPSQDAHVQAWTAAADQFIVARGELQTIIAGYHWFADWGRDTMISLPGLTLTTGRYDVARQILLAFAEHLSEGMLPNRFPDAGETPEYNTVDATLWFFEAIRAYLEHTGDAAFVREHLYAKLHDVVQWHLRGTRYGIHVDGDGLLRCGAPGVQLTWMDAKVGDWVVTPRSGKPVEIQALWYNALRVLECLSHSFGDRSEALFLGELASQAKASFAAQFWNAAEGCLFDVVDGEARDGAVRPNQVFAISLQHAILEDAERARSVLRVVESDLLTPMGLRSLSPRDSRYCAHYEGDVRSRDGAYHQGTVWPWLMGAFVDAWVKVFGDVSRPREWVRGFAPGQVPEIADAEAPFMARGCVAQAWSVAELLRVAVKLGV